MKTWNIWQALAWLRWGNEVWCDHYMGYAGAGRYLASLHHPDMPKKHPEMFDPKNCPPPERRSSEKAEQEIHTALRSKRVKTYPETDQSFWISRDHLAPRHLPENIRFVAIDVQRLWPSKDRGSAPVVVTDAVMACMTTIAKAARGPNRWVKAKEARRLCVAKCSCTTDEADEAFKKLPLDLKRSRGRPAKAAPQ